MVVVQVQEAEVREVRSGTLVARIRKTVDPVVREVDDLKRLQAANEELRDIVRSPAKRTKPGQVLEHGEVGQPDVISKHKKLLQVRHSVVLEEIFRESFQTTMSNIDTLQCFHFKNRLQSRMAHVIVVIQEQNCQPFQRIKGPVADVSDVVITQRQKRDAGHISEKVLRDKVKVVVREVQEFDTLRQSRNEPEVSIVTRTVCQGSCTPAHTFVAVVACTAIIEVNLAVFKTTN